MYFTHMIKEKPQRITILSLRGGWEKLSRGGDMWDCKISHKGFLSTLF